MEKLLIILGPTSTGKTDLALKFAKEFNGELVSCDSRQVYKSLDIGTGKLPGEKYENCIKGKDYWEIDGIRIWMYDVADPKDQYTVADYVSKARATIAEVLSHNQLPIIVGGTGFYLKALLEGLPSLGLPIDQKLRKQLTKISLNKLQTKLQITSPKRWEKMNYSDRQNPRRLIRAIEIAMQLKQSIISNLKPQIYNTIKIGLTAPRKILYQRINERVVDRINQGMLQEGKNLHMQGLSLERMKQLGLEYGVMADFLSGQTTHKVGMTKVLQNKIHGFARRQITWFKKEKDINWFDITDKKYIDKVEKLVAGWYYQPYAAKN